MTKEEMIAAIAMLKDNDTLRRIAGVLNREREDAEDSVISGADAARMLGCTRVSVCNFAKRGLIRRVRLPGRSKSLGYSRRSVVSLICR